MVIISYSIACCIGVGGNYSTVSMRRCDACLMQEYVIAGGMGLQRTDIVRVTCFIIACLLMRLLRLSRSPPTAFLRQCLDNNGIQPRKGQ
jgi:hypothetical protein